MVAAAFTAGTFSARAQVQVPGASTTTTAAPTTTTTRPATTTTTMRSEKPTTTTTARPAPTPSTPPAPSIGDDPAPSPGGGDDPRPSPSPSPSPAPGPVRPSPPPSGGDPGAADPSSRVVPPEYASVIASIKRSGPNNTKSLVDGLQPLADLGIDSVEAVVAGMGSFPVGGYATWTDDWWFPRFTPSFHLHQGTDIFATAGTPVRAPVDGVMRQSEGPVGGLSVYVTTADGTYYYLAHLSAYVAGQVTGQSVKRGEIVGYVGDTGNAKGGAPHVHFEVHPKGGGPINPKPILDQWVSEAMADLPKVIAGYERSRPRALIATGLTRRFAGGGEAVLASPARPPRSQLLWASSANPSGGALALAEAEIAALAEGIDWRQRARREEARAAAWRQAEVRAEAIVRPLTPPALASVLFPPRGA